MRSNWDPLLWLPIFGRIACHEKKNEVHTAEEITGFALGNMKVVKKIC